MSTAGQGVVPATNLSTSAMDDLLAPLERAVKTYLTETLSQDLIELMAIAAVERPKDPHLWMAQRLLEKSPRGQELFISSRDGKPAHRAVSR